VITKKGSEIKSFLLVFAQFPVPVLGMFRTGGRCQSVPPFPLTGDFRIPKLNQHRLRLRDMEIENSSDRRNVKRLAHGAGLPGEERTIHDRAP